jgi:hypothetical protein
MMGLTKINLVFVVVWELRAGVGTKYYEEKTLPK